MIVVQVPAITYDEFLGLWDFHHDGDIQATKQAVINEHRRHMVLNIHYPRHYPPCRQPSVMMTMVILFMKLMYYHRKRDVVYLILNVVNQKKKLLHCYLVMSKKNCILGFCFFNHFVFYMLQQLINHFSINFFSLMFSWWFLYHQSLFPLFGFVGFVVVVFFSFRCRDNLVENG